MSPWTVREFVGQPHLLPEICQRAAQLVQADLNPYRGLTGEQELGRNIRMKWYRPGGRFGLLCRPSSELATVSVQMCQNVLAQCCKG